MATDPHSELAQFQQFVGQHVQNGTPLSPEEVLDLWRIEHPQSLDDDAIAIRQALADFDAGEMGVPLDEFEREFRRRHNLPASE
jgi:hypothetical protein